MAENTSRRQGEIVQAVFTLLNERDSAVPAKEVIDLVARDLGLTPFEASDYPNRPGVRRFDKILRFATIAAVKAGWLIKSKGRWTVTEEGLAALKQYPDPEDFQKAARKLYSAWRKSQPDVDADDAVDSDEVSAATTLEEAEEAAWSEIAAFLAAMPPYDFQEMVGALLTAMGYHVSWIAPPGPDQGVDIVAFTDPLGAEGPRIKVQVKRQTSSKISVDGVRSFMAVLSGNDVGIFVSLGGFTSEAGKEARGQATRRINLIDMERLVDLWVQHYDAMPESSSQRLPLRPVYFLDPVGD
jgi:restriction system protein